VSRQAALSAASQMFGDAESAEHAGTLETGEEVYHVTRTGRDQPAVVTLNPNGAKACVEWRGREESGAYRVFEIRGNIRQEDP
jgi:hypothetical protein